jgi:hypothetical protein
MEATITPPIRSLHGVAVERDGRKLQVSLFANLRVAARPPRARFRARGGTQRRQSVGFQMTANTLSSSCPAARPRLA